MTSLCGCWALNLRPIWYVSKWILKPCSLWANLGKWFMYVIVNVWYRTSVFCYFFWCFFSFLSTKNFIQFANLTLFGFLQSSLAAARADNFYYPPEWTPNQVCFPLSLLFDFVTAVYVVRYFGSWHCFFCSGFFEQVSWSTCFKGESKKTWPGYLDYKVTMHTLFIHYLIVEM